MLSAEHFLEILRSLISATALGIDNAHYLVIDLSCVIVFACLISFIINFHYLSDIIPAAQLDGSSFLILSLSAVILRIIKRLVVIEKLFL